MECSTIIGDLKMLSGVNNLWWVSDQTLKRVLSVVSSWYYPSKNLGCRRVLMGV